MTIRSKEKNSRVAPKAGAAPSTARTPEYYRRDRPAWAVFDKAGSSAFAERQRELREEAPEH